MSIVFSVIFFFFFNDTATTEIYTLSLHDALPISGATDVIAFAFAPVRARGPLVGDVYIAPDVARAQARRLGVPVREELARLVVHGTLHVTGHDHPGGAARTRSRM